MTTGRAQDGDGGTPPAGLRERKKRATCEALSLAAVRLATERGLENVRSEDIAAEAGVSTRTFSPHTLPASGNALLPARRPNRSCSPFVHSRFIESPPSPLALMRETRHV